MDDTARWQRKDVWLGLLFVAAGALLSVYAFLAMRDDVTVALWGSAWLFGPLMLLLGGNAVVRSLRAGRGPRGGAGRSGDPGAR